MEAPDFDVGIFGGIVLLLGLSFVGWLVWEGLFWIFSHIHIG